jgi:hypothetical protein
MTTCVIGYANHLNTPLNIFTLTIILLGSQFGIQQMAKNFRKLFDECHVYKFCV